MKQKQQTYENLKETSEALLIFSQRPLAINMRKYSSL